MLDLTGLDEVVVVGDLHGHINNFRKAYIFADLAKNPRRHLVVQELIHAIERDAAGMDYSHRLVDLIAAAICQFPGRVHYLVGNHELAQLTKRDIAKNDFTSLNQLYLAGVQSTYGEKFEEIYKAYEDFWEVLPFAIRLPNQIMLSHTMPPAKQIDKFQLETLMKPTRTMEELTLGGSFHSIVWGRDMSEATAAKYMEKVHARFFIAGHIPCEEGVVFPNPYQCIIDSKDEDGCMLLLPTNKEVAHGELKGMVKYFKDMRL